MHMKKRLGLYFGTFEALACYWVLLLALAGKD